MLPMIPTPRGGFEATRDTGWTELPSGLWIRRTGDQVAVMHNGYIKAAGTGTVVIDTLPLGYRIEQSVAAPVFMATIAQQADVTFAGVVQFRNVPQEGQWATFYITYTTDDPLPA